MINKEEDTMERKKGKNLPMIVTGVLGSLYLGLTAQYFMNQKNIQEQKKQSHSPITRKIEQTPEYNLHIDGIDKTIRYNFGEPGDSLPRQSELKDKFDSKVMPYLAKSGKIDAKKMLQVLHLVDKEEPYGHISRKEIDNIVDVK